MEWAESYMLTAIGCASRGTEARYVLFGVECVCIAPAPKAVNFFYVELANAVLFHTEHELECYYISFRAYALLECDVCF